MGNSEVGHLNLGAGAVVKQDLARIDDAIADGSFFENEALRGRLRARPPEPARQAPPARPRLRRRRPLGLGAHRGGDRARHPGGRPRRRLPRLHRRPRHPAARRRRATSTSSSAGSTARAGSEPSPAATTRWTATRRWERTKLAYDAIVHGRGRSSAETPAEAIAAAYERGETDEFVKPTVIGELRRGGAGRRRDLPQLPPRPRPAADPGAGRARLRGVLAQRRPGPRPDDDDRIPQGLAVPGRLPRGAPGDDPGRGRSPRRAMRQLHVAETEKYAHVTYFFNGGREEEWERRRAASGRLRRATSRPTTTSRR